jgi:hypothetical protein
LARKVTVFPWNFFQSKPVAWAEPAAPIAITESINCAARALALIDVLPGGRAGVGAVPPFWL